MDNQLLVRMYNVGLGDCIYLRVPDREKHVYILIDCGNKFGKTDLLGDRISALQKELPDVGENKKRLDLLVVSHPHEDHHKGFEQEFFKDIKIENLWLSPIFDRKNPNAEGLRALQQAAGRALKSLSPVATEAIIEEVTDLLSLTNSQAIETLCHTLPEANKIKPLYVSADTPEDKLKIFQDKAIKLKVLGPMKDIDSYYLGGIGLLGTDSGLAPHTLVDGYDALFTAPGTTKSKLPKNISAQDFRHLQSRTPANVLAAVEMAGHIINNLSVVLLLEWHGRRLLFPGDAEWNASHQGEAKKGYTNGSWNVMWQERRKELEKPLDFLKVGHHGSENATPWTSKQSKGQAHPINVILDALLPLPTHGQRPNAQAIVSTKRTSKWPSIPDAELMVELGKRITNATDKYDDGTSTNAVPRNTLQPQRTDLEAQVTGTPDQPVPYIEIEFSPL